jgi:hypothetical protein
MSITFKSVSPVVAVVIGAAFLAASALWRAYPAIIPPPAIPRQDIADVNRVERLLQTAKGPITGILLCDPINALAPDKVDAVLAAKGIEAISDPRVIICFRGGVDYDRAQQIARQRKLTWSRGLAGGKAIVFARDQASFMSAAHANGLAVTDADLTSTSLSRALQPVPSRAVLTDRAWRINAYSGSQEALFGPYLTLAPGAYRLTVVFEPAEPKADCASFLLKLRAEVQITANTRSMALTQRQPLALRPRGSADCRWSAEVAFTVPAGPERQIETPFWVTSPQDVLLSDYEIDPAPAANSPPKGQRLRTMNP